MFEWVTLQKAADGTGYTANALRHKLKSGKLTKGHHWQYAPDGRILIHVANFSMWLNNSNTNTETSS
jgi:hypothetical protein